MTVVSIYDTKSDELGVKPYHNLSKVSSIREIEENAKTTHIMIFPYYLSRRTMHDKLCEYNFECINREQSIYKVDDIDLAYFILKYSGVESSL